MTAILLAVIPVALVALLVAVVFRRNITRALPFLIALNGISLTIGGGALRFDQLAGILLAGSLLAAVALGYRRLFVDRTAIFLAAFAALNVVASARSSPSFALSSVGLVSQIAVWLLYVVVVNYVDSLDELARFTKLFLVAGLAEAIVGSAAFVLAIVGLRIGGANADPTDFGNAFGAYGTLFEPNLFGNYCQIFFLTALGIIWLGRGQGRRAPRFVVGVAIASAVGLFLSFTRGAWLGTMFGMATLLVLGWRWMGVRVRPSHIVAPIVALALLSVALWFAPFGAGEFFRYKVTNFLNPESESASLRLVSYGLALQHIVEHPWLGSGTYSFAPLIAQGTDFRQFEGWRNLWIGNYALLVLHDTGVVGLLLWIAMLGDFLRRASRAARAAIAIDPERARLQTALVAAFASLLVSFLASSGFTLGYPWVLMGIIGAFTRLMTAVPGAERVKAAAVDERRVVGGESAVGGV